MGRIAIASQLVESQLQRYVEQDKFCFGLIIGQPSADGKDHVVYIAKTSIDAADGEDNTVEQQEPVDAFAKVDPQLLVNHAVYLTRMIPGCFYISGIFIVSEKNIFQDDAGLKKARQCVLDINKILIDIKVFRSDSTRFDNGEKLVMFCSSSGNHAITCKSLNTQDSSGPFKPAEWKVLDKPVTWHLFETNYDLDEVFPIIRNDNSVSLEENCVFSLKTIDDYLENSLIFIQQEIVEDSLTLEAYLKLKRDKKEPHESFKSTVFFPATISRTNPSKIMKYHGTIRYSGIVYSRIWVHSKTTFKDIQHFIRNDILRSLSARVQIYCDGLAEPTVAEGSFLVSEPPRRVFFKISGGDGIEFSEYLFRGEMAEVVVEQVKEMLDMQISPDDVETEVESVAVYDDDISTATDELMDNSEVNLPRKEVRKNMYLAGIVGALVVLILSLVLHFVFR